jgi:hypothetical protein
VSRWDVLAQSAPDVRTDLTGLPMFGRERAYPDCRERLCTCDLPEGEQIDAQIEMIRYRAFGGEIADGRGF